MQLKDIDWYRPKCYREYDIELMFYSLQNGIEDVPQSKFFEKIR